ncbi:RidA family protein [Psychromarinibacter halotolerans]|uniref:RidA family protein n=1 Tax=Psychromarinibacter halotolerans TaxID=1775175 RepID=A0ABV7GPK1_9RHOB|nr:RidA family protein [Psychromarinibacter halotolerans]MAQ83984.1 hypothetical protein [Maritimibacter sp.]MDF0597913.1 RidA family protein [Psychromarinibacter halotolerans]
MTKVIEHFTNPGATGTPPLSPAVRAGDYVFISGQVPAGADGAIVGHEIIGQTTQVMKNIEAALALAGCTMDDVCKTTVWLDDARDFGKFNTTYGSFFKNGFPARTTCESRLMANILVEVEAVAYKPL